MYFVRGLVHDIHSMQKGCHPAILLPPAIQSQTSPNQIAWPWGNETRNVACPSCKNVSAYSESHCRWHQVDSPAQHQAISTTAIYLFSVPCDIGLSVCLVDIRVLAKRGLTQMEDIESANGLFLMRATCDKGHLNTGSVIGRSLQFGGETHEPWQMNHF